LLFSVCRQESDSERETALMHTFAPESEKLGKYN